MVIDDEIYHCIKRKGDKDNREMKQRLKGELRGKEEKLLKFFEQLLC